MSGWDTNWDAPQNIGSVDKWQAGQALQRIMTGGNDPMDWGKVTEILGADPAMKARHQYLGDQEQRYGRQQQGELANMQAQQQFSTAGMDRDQKWAEFLKKFKEEQRQFPIKTAVDLEKEKIKQDVTGKMALQANQGLTKLQQTMMEANAKMLASKDSDMTTQYLREIAAKKYPNDPTKQFELFNEMRSRSKTGEGFTAPAKPPQQPGVMSHIMDATVKTMQNRQPGASFLQQMAGNLAVGYDPANQPPPAMNDQTSTASLAAPGKLPTRGPGTRPPDPGVERGLDTFQKSRGVDIHPSSYEWLRTSPNTQELQRRLQLLGIG